MSTRLEIHQTFGQIAISQTAAKIRVSQPPAQLTIHQEPANLQIQGGTGKLMIDQSGPFSDEGLMSSTDLARKAAQEGQKSALAYIGSTAADGDQLKFDIKSGHAIPDLAEKNSRPPVYDFNVALVPSSPIKINYEPKQAEFYVQIHRADIEVKIHHANIKAILGGTQVRMAKYPSITMQTVGQTINAVV